MTMDVSMLPEIDQEKIKISPTGCWEWNARRDQSGYGQVKRAGRVRRAHRYVYELLVGPLADNRQLDHLCRVRHCVNPAHLEPVTPIENVRRGLPAVGAEIPADLYAKVAKLVGQAYRRGVLDGRRGA